ncbi:MAG: exopolysaccharide biosynthesis protein [Hyphomonadaceae bacterium]|nr:MAG: exopolysaccharide synthesis exod [Caulobacteraceae bacterium]MBT9446726.1 exopolysaccharide biosynthesis protein [Hyphomonadaceae bacterium]TPW06765.1 MAG: exopolysaccharide synthesis exod [Alphaproteobacteria bacterium]
MDQPLAQPHAKEHLPPASELLQDLMDAFPEEHVTVGEILKRLEGQAFGLLLLVLALPNCIPNIPGLSTIFGVMMVAPAVQLILGRGDLWLPARVRRWSISRHALQMAINGSLPILKRIERYVAPRWAFLVKPPFTQFLGLQTLFLAFVLILPIPLGNWMPGVTVAATALALLQRDGRLVLLSVPLTLVSIALAWAGIRIGMVALREVGEMLQVAYGALF